MFHAQPVLWTAVGRVSGLRSEGAVSSARLRERLGVRWVTSVGIKDRYVLVCQRCQSSAAGGVENRSARCWLQRGRP